MRTDASLFNHPDTNSRASRPSRTFLPPFSTSRWTRILVACLLVAALGATDGAGAFAQPVDSLIAKGKRLVDEGYDDGSVQKLRRAVSLFERATRGNDHTALAHYYAGFAHKRLLDISEQENEDKSLKYLNASIDHLESAVEKDDEFAEAYALLASVYGRKIGKNPKLGIILGPKTSQTMGRAKELAPNNPRVVMMQATSDLFTPETWGGDLEKALDGFQRAIELFKTHMPSGPLQPGWGHSEAYAWLGIAYMKKDKHGKAETAFRKALKIDPDFGWVKHVLLPKAKKEKEVSVSK